MFTLFLVLCGNRVSSSLQSNGSGRLEQVSIGVIAGIMGGSLAMPGPVPSGEEEQLRLARRAGGLQRRGLFDHRVGVGAADPEGAHTRAPWLAVPHLPIAGLRHDIEGAVLEIDLRIRLLEVQAHRQLLVLQGEHRLDEAAHARRRVEVAARRPR